MEFYYKSDFALVVSLSDVLTNEVRVYTTDRKRYIVAEAEVIDEDTTRLWVRGNAESHILNPGRVNIEVWSRSGDVMLVALYWLEVWLSPTEVPEGQMDVTALAPYAIVDAYDMAVSAGYTGTREEYMAALLSAGTPSVAVAYLVDGNLDKTFSELAGAWEEGHMLCVIDDGDVLPLSGVYDDSLVFSQVIGDELMIVTLMDDDSVEVDVSELGGGCFIVPVSLSGGGAYSTTVPFAEVLDAYDSGKVVMYEHDKMRWIAQHKAVRNNVTTLFATNVKYLGSWNNSEPNMSTLRHSSNEVVSVSAVDLQPRLTAGTGIDITNNVISANIPDGAYIIDVDLDADPMTTTAVFADALAAFEAGRQVWFACTSGGSLTFAVPVTFNYGGAALVGVTWMDGEQEMFTFTANGVSLGQTSYVDTTALSTALAGKQDVLTFDNVPTQSSNNPVKSGGVYDAFSTYCPIIEDTRSSAVATITGVAPFTSLVDGQRIVLHFKYRNEASPTLQLTLSGGTTTAAIPLYQNYNSGVGTLTVQAMPAGSYGEFVYDQTNSRWMLIGKDVNTTYANTSQADINNSAQGSRLIEPKLLRDNFYLKSESDANYLPTLVEVTTTGDVTQALDSGKFYRFGEVDSLTLTFTAPSAGMGMWGGKFTASASWSALGIPATIDEATGNDTIAGGKTYEFNVLDGIIVVKEV